MYHQKPMIDQHILPEKDMEKVQFAICYVRILLFYLLIVDG